VARPLAGLALVVILAATCAASASAGTPLSKTQYLARLRAANADAAKAGNVALAGANSKSTTAAKVKANFMAWGATETRLGRSFAALTPPAAATKANADLAHADKLFGAQLLALAAKFPSTKAGIFKLLLSTNLSAKKLVDHAVAELHAAGFRF
jgi:ABC-type glycerol-3-phosphate transport system substrate-binding protein